MPNNYGKREQYDTILLLTGENEKRLRSGLALELYTNGLAEHIFVTGGYGAFAETKEGLSEAEDTKRYLNEDHGIPEHKIMTDDQSYETLGNFAMPEATPQEKNPPLSDLGNLVIVSEFEHLKRAIGCADKVLSNYDIFSPDRSDYNNGIVQTIYHTAMMRRLRDIREPSPKEVKEFLMNEHPFYQNDWYSKSILERKIDTMYTVGKWLTK